MSPPFLHLTLIKAEDFIVKFSDGTEVPASALRDLLETVQSLQAESVATLFFFFDQLYIIIYILITHSITDIVNTMVELFHA